MPGGAELFFIVLVIIMLFGSKKIPELARGLGKGMREIKNATGDIQREITEGARDINSIKDKVNVEKQVKDLVSGNQEKKPSLDAEQEVSSVEEKKENLEQKAGTQEQDNANTPPVSQTVQRRSVYAANDGEDTTGKVE